MISDKLLGRVRKYVLEYRARHDYSTLSIGLSRAEMALDENRGHIQKCLSMLAKEGIMFERQKPESGVARYEHGDTDKHFKIRISKSEAMQKLAGTTMNVITHVAIVYKDKTYSLPAPNRHHNVIHVIAEENGVGIRGTDIQGFLDSEGNFLDREQAFILASKNGQLKRRTGPNHYQGNELFSEDLW